MPDRESVVTRFVAKVRAVLDEDWVGTAGRRFRRTISKISQLNQNHLHLGERASAAPDLAWTAVQGVASEKHAKAASDYSKAENDRIDVALKRRVLEDKVRQERATADRLEAEANLARIRELQSRLDLAKQLAELGVALVLDENAVIRAYKHPHYPGDILSGVLNVKEHNLLRSTLIDVVVPEMSAEIRIGTLTRWIRTTGDHVVRDEPILEVSTYMVDSEIPCPADGTPVEVLVPEGTQIKINETVVARIQPTVLRSRDI